MRGRVALGGALGSVARVGVDTALPAPAGLPAATLLVNVSGALLLGLLVARTRRPGLRALLGTGALGAWTTFSSFAVELDELLRRDPRIAIGYAAVSIAAGLAAAAIGGHTGARLRARATHDVPS